MGWIQRQSGRSLRGIPAYISPTQPPSLPVLSVVVISASQLNVSWTASTPGTNPIARYRLQISTNNLSFGSDITQLTLSYNWTGLNAATLYYFRVRAEDTQGYDSAWAYGSGTTNSSGLPQVTGLTASTVGSASIALSWNALSGATYYNVYQNGTLINQAQVIPPLTSITDSFNNVWTVVGGVVQENGSPIGVSANVTQLVYTGGVFYQENSAANWYSWNASAWVNASDPLLTGTTFTVSGLTAATNYSFTVAGVASGVMGAQSAAATANTASANGATIPSSTELIDNSGNLWTVVSGVIYENGVAAGVSSNVILLLWYNGAIYQENSSDNWYEWNGTTYIAVSGDPRQAQSFGIKIANGQFVNLQGVVTPLVVMTFDGSEVMKSNGTMIQGIAAITPAQWTAGLNQWGPSGGYTKYSQINCIRIPVHSAYWLNVSGVDASDGYWFTNGAPSYSAATYQGYVSTIIANLTAAGIYSMFDLHMDNFIAANGTRYLSIGQPCAPCTDAYALWQSAAALYKNNPAVIYEMFNEPFFSNIGQSASGYGAYGNQNAALASNAYSGPVALGADASAYINATTGTQWGPPPGNSANGTPAGFTLQNNDNGDDLYAPAPSQAAMIAGAKQMLTVIANTGATNVVLISLPLFAGGIDMWSNAGFTDPRGNGQIGAATHAYGWGHMGSIQALHAAGIPTCVTEADGGDFANAGYTYSGLYALGCGYAFFGYNNYGFAANASSSMNSSPWGNSNGQGMPQPTGSN